MEKHPPCLYKNKTTNLNSLFTKNQNVLLNLSKIVTNVPFLIKRTNLLINKYINCKLLN